MVLPASMFATQLPHRHASHKSITDNIAFQMGYSIGGSCRRSAIPGSTAYDKVSLPFSDRSAGFIWFFSFLVLFAQVKKTHVRRRERAWTTPPSGVRRRRRRKRAYQA